MSLAEKFQITAPPEPEPGHTWTTLDTYRRTGEAGFAHSTTKNAFGVSSAQFNEMPPGEDISNTPRKRINNMPLSMAGETDVSNNVTTENLHRGFFRAPMQGTDDQYSGEHIDLFYGEVEDELGNCGFVERNNYLDRL